MSADPKPKLPLPPLPEFDHGKNYNFFSPVFWGCTDNARLVELMKEARQLTPAYHFGDNMFVFGRNLSHLRDASFVEAWKCNNETTADETIVWRRYILCMAAFHCLHLEGDFVECGAYTGVGMKTVIDYLGGVDFPKHFWGYDLFDHDPSMRHSRMQEHSETLHQRVADKFSAYKQVTIVKGELPGALRDNSPEKIAYLHIDLNQAPAEIGCLEMLWDRLVPGGLLILDDYEQRAYGEQKKHEDQWLGARGHRVFPLPTSQGLVIKRA